MGKKARHDDDGKVSALLSLDYAARRTAVIAQNFPDLQIISTISNAPRRRFETGPRRSSEWMDGNGARSGAHATTIIPIIASLLAALSGKGVFRKDYDKEQTYSFCKAGDTLPFATLSGSTLSWL
ncbi:MAG: hypothetical protein R2834_13355 [Rhodothermales bacterium]